VQKAVGDILEVTYPESTPGRRHGLREPEADYRPLGPERALQRIKQLEERMYRHARELEFEQAAQLRDEIARIRASVFGAPDRAAG
jgi:excinuclease ABC subunit B